MNVSVKLGKRICVSLVNNTCNLKCLYNYFNKYQVKFTILAFLIKLHYFSVSNTRSFYTLLIDNPQLS